MLKAIVSVNGSSEQIVCKDRDHFDIVRSVLDQAGIGYTFTLVTLN